MRSLQEDARLYRAFTIISDSAIIIGVLAFVLGFVAPTTGPLPWFAAAAIAGLIVIAARSVALRYQPSKAGERTNQ